MKILYVTRPLCPPWDEASKNFAFDLARNITTEEITVLTCGELDGLPPNVHQTPAYSECPFGLRQKFESLLAQFRLRGRFDVNHYFFTPTPLNSFLARMTLAPRTRSIQTVATLRVEKYSPEALRRALFADKLVSYTRRTKKLVENLGFCNVEQIYPGIDLERFAPREKPDHLRQHFDIPAGAAIISFPGEYVRLGGAEPIVTAMERVWETGKQEFSSPPILILALRVKNAADAEEKKKIQNRLKRNGYLNLVRFTDTFDDMPGLYNLSDIILFPVSNLHGKFDVPLALIEAYAAGKPTVVSDIGELAEFTNENFSVIIKKNDASELAAAIVALVGNENRRKLLGKRARQFAVENFNIKTISQKYEQIYRSLRRESNRHFSA